VLSRHDSRAAPQTVQTASPVCGTKNFSSVRLYSAPQLHCTIVAIPGICISDRPDAARLRPIGWIAKIGFTVRAKPTHGRWGALGSGWKSVAPTFLDRASDHPRKDENTDLDQEDDACDGNRKKHVVGGQEKHGSPRLWTSPQSKIDRKWPRS
jgi:hypothetical protein